jgi:hypothetical protein
VCKHFLTEFNFLRGLFFIFTSILLYTSVCAAGVHSALFWISKCTLIYLILSSEEPWLVRQNTQSLSPSEPAKGRRIPQIWRDREEKCSFYWLFKYYDQISSAPDNFSLPVGSWLSNVLLATIINNICRLSHFIIKQYCSGFHFRQLHIYLMYPTKCLNF